MATPVRQKCVDKIRQTFSYCDLCRHSHEQGKRHAFSRRHRDKVKAVLSKFSAKVKAAKQDMKTPCILEGNYEPRTNYWCYMCASEVPKHITDREVTVRHAGFIEHLMSCEHAQKVDRFWRMNRIETDLQSKFIFNPETKEMFKKAVEEALTRHEEQQQRLLSQAAAKIRKVESNRLQVLESSGSSISMFGSESSEVCYTQQSQITPFLQHQHQESQGMSLCSPLELEELVRQVGLLNFQKESGVKR